MFKKMCAYPSLKLTSKHLSFYQRKQVAILMLEPDLPYPDFVNQYRSFVEKSSPYYPVRFEDTVINVINDKTYDLSRFDAFLLSGGKGDINKRKDLNRLIEALSTLKNSKIMIGFCLGYQLLVRLFGGTVRQHPLGVRLNISPHSVLTRKEWIYPHKNNINVYMCHGYYSNTLGKTTECLFSNNDTSFAGAQFNSNVVGIQGHPEVRNTQLDYRFKDSFSVKEVGVDDGEVEKALESFEKNKETHELVRTWFRNFLALRTLSQDDISMSSRQQTG